MAEESGGALREILAFFDMQVGQEQLEKATTAIESTKKQFAELAEVALTGFAVEKIVDFVKETVEMGEELSNTAKSLGVTTDDLQLFRGSLDLAGSSADYAGGLFKEFNKAVLGAATGADADAASAFQKLGIKVKDSNGDLITLTGSLEDIADKLEQVEDPMQRAAIKAQIFGKFGAQMTEMLEKGADGVRDLKKEVTEAGGVLDASFIQQAKKAGDELKKSEMATRALKVTFITEFMPSITAVILKIRQGVMWFKDLADHTYIVKEALAALAAFGVLKVLSALMELAKFMGVMKEGSEVGLIGQILGLGEVGLIIAAAVALYLIFDDLFNLFEGNESLIGDTLNDMLGFDKATTIVTNLKDAWHNLSDAFSGMSTDLPTMSSTITAMVLAVTVLVEWWVILEQTVAAILNTIVAIGKILATDMTSGHWAKDIDAIGRDWDKKTDANWDRISKAFNGGAAAADAIVPAFQTAGKIQPSDVSVGQVNVAITATSPLADPSKMNEAQYNAWVAAIQKGVKGGMTDEQIQAAYAAATSRGRNAKAVDTGANR